MTPASPSRAARFPIPAGDSAFERSARNRWFSAARGLLLGTLLTAPLALGAVQPWAEAALDVSIFLLFLLWTVGSVREGRIRVVWSPLYLPAALFLLLGAAQYFGRTVVDRFAAREALIALVAYAILFFVSGQLLDGASDAAWEILGLVVLGFAFLVGLFAILQFFSSQGLIYWTIKSPGAAFGPYVNHNDFAGLMEMLIPVAAACALSRPEGDPRRAFLGFMVCIPMGALLLSGSRGGFVAMLGEVVIFGVILWKRIPPRQSRSLLPLATLAVAAAALIFFWMAPRQISKHLETVTHVVKAPEATYGDRRHVALDCLRIFRDHPVIGVGLGSFATVFPSYQSFPTNQLYRYAHNDYAQALAETGGLGGLIILGALALFFHQAFKDLRVRIRGPAGWIQLGATLGVCGLLIHSLVDFNLHIPANAAWFVVLAAAATMGSDTQSSRMKARAHKLGGEPELV